MTKIDYTHLPRAVIDVDATKVVSPFEGWRHMLGQGGINSLPLPEKVVEGVRKLKPKLIRIFLQEFFDIYPQHGVFNWDKLDPFMDSFARTGAKVMASINIKPRVLYPELDQDTWRPNDMAEWQNVIAQLVRRYSVERPIVTHWEHFNEPDIGEYGGCPFRILSAAELHEAYGMLLKPILEVFPAARVGGPCPADYRFALGFIDACAQHGTPLDFVSIHRYEDDVTIYPRMAEALSEKLDAFPGKRPELVINEWNKGFDLGDSSDFYEFVSVEEMAMQPRRAAIAARIILAMMDAGYDASFYYHLWDSGMSPLEFSTFFSPQGVRGVMYKHWNEAPHRFGMFNEGGAPRPQYFLYQALSRMGTEKLAVESSSPDIQAVAAHGEGKLALLAVNFNPMLPSQDQIIKIRFKNLAPGIKRLSAYRIDDEQRWSAQELELLPCEQRTVNVLPDFHCQFYCPADSILWVVLED